MVEYIKSAESLLSHVARKCVGIDIDPDGIAYLQELGFDARLADAQNFDLGESFDLIVAGDILEHLHDFRGFFESISRHLKPDGILILTTANPWFFVRFLYALLRGTVPVNPEHVCWFSIETLTELLDRYGYAVSQAQYGSSEEFLHYLCFLPKIMRHTGFYIVAKRMS